MYMALKDLTGQKLGELQVISRAENHITKGGNSIVMWNCKCDCGRDIIAYASSLRQGQKSCGMCATEKHIGKRFGRLVVESVSDKLNNSGSKMLHCKCDCGNYTDASISALNSGATVSCGCYIKEIARKVAPLAHKAQGNYDGTSLQNCKSNTIPNTNTSGYRGVTYNKKSGMYQAYIMFKKRHYYLGAFDKAEEASKAYQTAKEKIHGEFVEWYEQNIKKSTTSQ